MVFNKRRYRATIQNKEYTIVGSKSDEHMDVVIDSLNEQIDQLKALSEKMTTEEAAILVAINAISEKVDMQEELITHSDRQQAKDKLED